MAKEENNNKKKAGVKKDINNATKEEQIGFHKGALTTLAKERQEFIRLLSIVEQLMQMHINALKELGVDLEEEAKKVSEKPKHKKPKKPIEDVLE